MANDKRVISLEERRRKAGRGQRVRAAKAEPAGQGATEDTAGPLAGQLIWLYCPTCKIVEYTEMRMTGGRVHNVCGTQVEDSAVELDLRAEYTIAEINLERLSILEHLLQSERMRYEEYRKRLALAAGRSIEAYPFSEETIERLPVEEVDAFGLLVSRFFHEPASHFAGDIVVEPGTQEGRGKRED